MSRKQAGLAGSRLAALAALLCGLIVSACGQASARSSRTNMLAAAPDYAGHPTIDGIPCETMERVSYHVHAHLAVFVDGQQSVVPEGLGIASPRQVQNTSEGPFVASGSCFYWLHTHTADGIIHVESPVPQSFKLGQLFDVWQQPLSSDQVGPARGQVLAYVNGQRYPGDPKQIDLAAHAVIQLDVGQDVPPRPFAFPSGL